MPAKKTASKKKTGTTKKAAAKKKAVVKKSTVKKAAARKTSSVKKAVARKAVVKKKAVSRKSATNKPGKPRVAKGMPTGGGGELLSYGGIMSYKPGKGEEYMSDAQVEHFRKILEAWKAELMNEVDRTVHHMQDDAANFPDPNDRATQEEEFSLELRTRDRERKLIKKIEESLLALDNGEYGYCESCGIEIGIRRLEARPTATLCIDCKTLDEIREKQRG